jgi:sugar lactone lactonase YvrE
MLNSSNRRLIKFTVPNYALLLLLICGSILFGEIFSNTTVRVKAQGVGIPEITSVTPRVLRLEGGTDVVVTGRNFTPDSVLVLGGTLLRDAKVVSPTEIRFQVSPQNVPGVVTLSVLASNGLAQQELDLVAKPVAELAIGEITTLAGGRMFIGDGGPATKASLAFAEDVAVDSAGNIFIADSLAERVRRIDARTGTITTVAGGGASIKDGELAITSNVVPSNITLDKAGNLFVADSSTNTIRRVDILKGTITTVAGNGERAFSGDGGPASRAGLGQFLRDIAFDGNNNLYIAADGRVRRIDARTGLINTVAGSNSTTFNGDGGPATSAGIFPGSIALDAANNLFIADPSARRVRRVDAASGIITTVAGNGSFGNTGKLDGKIATDVGIFGIGEVVIDANGDLLLLAAGVLRINLKTGIINSLPTIDPLLGGLSTSGGFTIDNAGNIYITSSNRVVVRPANSNTGDLMTIAGTLLSNYRNDGPAAQTSLGYLSEAVAESNGNILIADQMNNFVRRLNLSNNQVTTIAGSGPRFVYFQGQGDGKPATSSEVAFIPDAIDVDNAGNLYILDGLDARVRRVDARTGVIRTIAGNSKDKISGDGGPATKAGLGQPIDLALDANGNLFVSVVNRIRRIDGRTNIITTVAGNGERVTSGDGGPATSAGMSPRAIAIDRAGNIFLLDSGRIRRIDAKTGTINTVAGNGQDKFSGEGGPATNAGLGIVTSIAVDADGNLFIGAAELETPTPGDRKPNYNARILQVDARTGLISTVVAGKTGHYSGDGGPAANASLSSFPRINLDRNGNLLIVDGEFGTSVRMVKLSSKGSSTGDLSITGVAYQKRTLIVEGNNLSTSGMQIIINGEDVTSLTESQSNNQLILRGSRKMLNLKKDGNEIMVLTSNGASISFSFSF